MDLISLLVLLVVIGAIVFLVNQYVPMSPPFKTVFNIVVIVALCLLLLRLAGIGNIWIGRR